VHAWLGLVVASAACWTSPEPAKPPANAVPSSATIELRATLHFEAGGQRFRGVWLEHGDTRHVIDYYPHEMWRSFENVEVIATGHACQPRDEALLAPHFRVERMRLVAPRGGVPLTEVLGETKRSGRFITHAFPPGSKLADSPEITFADARGTEYFIEGASVPIPPAGTAVSIRARDVIVEPAYTARPGGPRLWLLAIVSGDDDEPRCP
jgi:hypothetical protein